MVPWNSALGGFAYNWQSKWVRIIDIKTERKQIEFLRDVLVAVATLDLKVPIICICVNTEDIKLRPEQKSPRASYAAAQNKLLALKKCQSALAH